MYGKNNSPAAGATCHMAMIEAISVSQSAKMIIRPAVIRFNPKNTGVQSPFSAI